MSRFDDDSVSASDLASLDRAFGAAPDANEPVPDGSYSTMVDAVSIRRSKSSGAPMVEWKLRITEGICSGRVLWKYTTLTEERLAYAKADLRLCGLELERLSDLPGHLNDLLDLPLDVTVKTKGDFQSVNFRRPNNAERGSGSNGLPI